MGAVALLMTALLRAQAPIDVYELADYRLTPEVFERFVVASRRIGTGVNPVAEAGKLGLAGSGTATRKAPLTGRLDCPAQ